MAERTTKVKIEAANVPAAKASWVPDGDEFLLVDGEGARAAVYTDRGFWRGLWWGARTGRGSSAARRAPLSATSLTRATCARKWPQSALSRRGYNGANSHPKDPTFPTWQRATPG